ncbi:MAG: ATP-binding protein [Pseudomonadota bacterium]
MSAGRKDDWAEVWREFQGFWDDLGLEDRSAFWKNASKYAYDMNHRSEQYRRLCLALHEVESGANPKRVSGLIPIKAKQRSASELQRAVARHKAKLLLVKSSQEFLVNAACNWIQFSFTAALNDLLDALGCERDEEGIRKGPVPAFSPQDGSREALRLAETHGTRQITLVCTGLMLSSADWSGLYLAREDLKRTPFVDAPISPEPVAAKVLASEGSVVHATEPLTTSSRDAEEAPDRPLDGTALEALKSALDVLANLLATASHAASSGEVPDSSFVIEFWGQLQIRHSTLAAQLGVETSSLSDLTNALMARNQRASTLDQLARCREISHLSEPDFALIRDKCDELEGALRLDRYSSTEELAVRSLLRLVNERELLDKDLAVDLQFEVYAVFGRTVATAAMLGKLVAPPLDPLSADSSETAAPDTTAVAEAASVTLLPGSEPIPLAEVVASDLIAHEGVLPEEPLAQDEITPPFYASQALDAKAVAAPLDILASVPTSNSSIDVTQLDSIPLPTIEKPPEPAVDFESFDEFCRTNWVDASGHVAAAPWSVPGFAEAISNRAVQAWRVGDAGLAYLFARGAHAADTIAPLQLDDLAQADELLLSPNSPAAGRQAERVDRLRRSLAPDADGDRENYSFGICLMLEALKPTLPCTLTPSEVESLLKRAAYHDSGITDIVRFLLTGWAAQVDPLESLRRRLLDARPEPFEKLEEALRKAQEALKREVAALWSAAGGKIQRTHCRAAWTRFVQEQVAPLRDELAPNGPKGVAPPKLPASSIGSRVVGIGRAFVRIMDNAEVKRQDRSAADYAAEQIVSAISRVADTLQEVETRRQQDKSRASYDGVPFEAGMRVLAGASSSITDRLCASLFAAVLKRQPQVNALRLDASRLLSHFDIIRFVNPSAFTRTGIAQNGLCMLDVDDPRAASVLLWNSAAGNDQTPDNDEEFLAALRDEVAEGSRRDVLAALSQTNVLLDHQRTLLHQYAFDLAADTFQATQRLEVLWSACDDLMAPNEAMLKVVVDQAKEMMKAGQDAGVSVNRRLLRLNWLARNIELATKQRDSVADGLVAQARANSPELAERIVNAFKADDYRAGFALLHGGVVPMVESSRLGGRRTIWRDDALSLWPDPKTKLAQDLRGSTEEQQQLADIWSSGAAESEQREALPKLLYAVISGETDRARNERRPVRLGELREHQARRTVVTCGAIRNYFQKTGMNPTFLPQLAEYGKIIILPFPQLSVRGGVPSDWMAATASDEATRTLYAFLAPGIPLSRRDDLCADLRKRGITAAIIDDIDVCRLCAAFSGSNPQNFVPFLEILLEQIDLVDASPFSSLDGQHVRLETYVGRDQEARKIALSAEYTRLFSGRKLGKSALLKYVADRFDGRKLDSENTLNVFFITIAGGDSEPWVVDAILTAMIERFQLPERSEARGLEAAARFMDYMNHVLSERPSHNVLLILDEADAFVEQQLARYNMARDNSDREGSLSFRMMKQLPAQDAKGLPRIRTLFSGYRTTNTRGGVWANAGDVLLLPPLEQEEAVKFLQGMLARIGISLGNHAPFVAMRCGFQPAVLIRFGESLVKRLRRATRSAHRETLIVSREEVSATLAEQAVLDEIKTVVNNNFQGNRMGAVVFGATLLALKDLQPGFALTDGAAQVLNKLSKIDPNLDWLEQPLAEIERHLQDFIERGLLTQAESHRRLGDREYRLRFPHFLTVLTRQSDVVQEVRQQIQAIRAGGTQRRVVECVLSESALSTVRYWYRECDTATCKLVVIGGHWAQALLDRKCGVPDRLGCDKHGVADLATADRDSPSWPDGVRVLCNASSRAWPKLLSAPAARPLVVIGDLDLLRVAIKHAFEGGEVPVEVITQGRPTQATLAWWFEDARALHFSSSDAIARIARATDLVPYLVDAFDRLLPHAPGTDVSPAELQAALHKLNESLPDLALRLCDASQPGHLLPREAQLLAMAGRVAGEVTDEFDLEREFQDCWTMLDLPVDGIEPPLSEAGDWQAMKLLVESGLLPARIGSDDNAGGQSLGRVRFDRSGPLVHLIKAIGSSRAA